MCFINLPQEGNVVDVDEYGEYVVVYKHTINSLKNDTALQWSANNL